MLASVYLHGFASSPQSSKARHLWTHLADYGPVRVPDLNVPDFTHLSMHSILDCVAGAVEEIPSAVPVLLVGSSMGGYAAAAFVAAGGRADALVLLAPALDPASLWLTSVSEADRARWEATGTQDVEHHAYQRKTPLHYRFYEEVVHLPAFPDASRVPTLIIHGVHDTVVSPDMSVEYVRRHPATRLVPVSTDHQMANDLDVVWETVHAFLVAQALIT